MISYIYNLITSFFNKGSTILQKNKNILENELKNTGDSIKKVGGKVKNELDKAGNEIKKKTGEVKNELDKAGNEIKKKTGEVKNELKKAGEEIKKKSIEITDEIKKKGNEIKTKMNEIYKNLVNEVQVGLAKFKLNTSFSQIDSDDKKFSKYMTAVPIPSGLDLRNNLKPIRNQGPDGCCVAFALCSMKEFQEIKSDYFTDYLSPWFIYLQREDPTESGMNPKNALQILQNYGVCTEKEFPYLKAKSKVEIKEQNFINAKNFVIKDFAYINKIEDLKQALHQNGPCIVAAPCFNDSKTFWKKVSKNDKLLGGHCVLAVGYHPEKGFIIRNSWGDTWGENGYTWLPYEDWPIVNECWTTIDIESSEELKLIISEEESNKILNNNVLPTNNNLIISLIIFIIILVLFGIYMFRIKK